MMQLKKSDERRYHGDDDGDEDDDGDGDEVF